MAIEQGMRGEGGGEEAGRVLGCWGGLGEGGGGDGGGGGEGGGGGGGGRARSPDPCLSSRCEQMPQLPTMHLISGHSSRFQPGLVLEENVPIWCGCVH